MIHGEYNYHNIIMTKEGIATTNFEKFRRDIQVEDLYYFLRKVLEKSGWKIRLGDGMLNAYSAIHPLKTWLLMERFTSFLLMPTFCMIW